MKFNVFLFWALVGILVLLTFTSLIGAMIYDEGMGDNLILSTSYLIFSILRFPSNALWFERIIGTHYLIGLVLNSFINAFIIERLVAVGVMIKRKVKK